MEDLDKILSDVALEEERLDASEKEDWWCMECEHGPMEHKEDKCTRCGARSGKVNYEEEMDGWEDEDIESEVEEIW